jgi:predicted GNAT family N-acyltransferase
MKIFKCKTQKEFLDNVLVRGKVFIVEQEIDWELEFDGLDDRCSLYIAYEGEEPVGAARLYKNKVGRVATLKEYRKKGVATALMKFIEIDAKTNGLKELKLNAQLYIADFYENIGYVKQGDIFMEAEIEHIKMTKVL